MTYWLHFKKIEQGLLFRRKNYKSTQTYAWVSVIQVEQLFRRILGCTHVDQTRLPQFLMINMFKMLGVKMAPKEDKNPPYLPLVYHHQHYNINIWQSNVKDLLNAQMTNTITVYICAIDVMISGQSHHHWHTGIFQHAPFHITPL